jgi:lysophospholipid acyltransferase (LPLAT)-like uncharacterized protein
VAILWFAIAAIYRLTLRVDKKGLHHLAGQSNHIYVFWHENLPLYFHTHLRINGPQVWMQHPALFMTPVHAMIRLMGVRHLAFGSTGNDGKKALEEIIGLLKKGHSTVITPDGPRGPVKQLKPGAFIMAMESGVPIIPMTFEVRPAFRLPTWDRKRWPTPFARIAMTYHAPIAVGRVDDKTLWVTLEKLLNT